MSQSSGYPALLPRPPNLPPPGPDLPEKVPKRLHTVCTSCRTRKVKCDAQRPTCSTCLQAGIQCVYDVPVGITRQAMSKRMIENMKKSNSDIRNVVELLREGDEADAINILQRIRQEDNIDDAIETIAGAQNLLVALESADQPPKRASDNDSMEGARPSRIPRSSLTSSPGNAPSPDKASSSSRNDLGRFSDAFQGHYTPAQYAFVERDMYVDHSVDITPWTNASDDNRMMNHLLSLFWTWDNHVERVIYRPLFQEDLARGRERNWITSSHAFCSPFLVNALLALGCLYSMDPAVFARVNDSTSRGRSFAMEADWYLNQERHVPSIPLLQGLYAMHWYEGNLGSGRKSIEYLHQAIDIFRQINTPAFLEQQADERDGRRLLQESEALSWVMWGLYCAEWRSSAGLGFHKLVAKPLVSQLWSEPEFTLARPESPEYWWFPYPVSSKAQRSMRVEIREYDLRLSEIVEDILDLLASVTIQSAQSIQDKCERATYLYDRLYRWSLSLPPRLRVEDATLPRVILLHCASELMQTALLRPFSALSEAKFGAFDPRERCYLHACNLSSAIWTYRAFAFLSNEYWLTYALSHVTFITLDDFDHNPPHTEALLKACQCLSEMTATLPLASDVLSALASQIRRSRIQLPAYIARFFTNAPKGRRDGLLHHTFVPLMPVKDAGSVEAMQSLRLQDLLDSLGDLAMA